MFYENAGFGLRINYLYCLPVVLKATKESKEVEYTLNTSLLPVELGYFWVGDFLSLGVYAGYGYAMYNGTIKQNTEEYNFAAEGNSFITEINGSIKIKITGFTELSLNIGL